MTAVKRTPVEHFPNKSVKCTKRMRYLFVAGGGQVSGVIVAGVFSEEAFPII